MKHALCSAALLANFLVFHASVRADVLYQIDFTPPDVGSYTVVGGTPTVVSSFGGMTDALLFHASEQNPDAISLTLGAQPSGYNVDFDLVTHGLKNSMYVFTTYLQNRGTDVHDVSLHGGQNAFHIFQPNPYTIDFSHPFLDDTIYHLSISVDFPANTWQVSVNSLPIYSNAFNSTSGDIAQMTFAVTGWNASAADDPNVLVALDNIQVVTIPEPSSCALFFAAIMVLYAGRRLSARPRGDVGVGLAADEVVQRPMVRRGRGGHS